MITAKQLKAIMRGASLEHCAAILGDVIAAMIERGITSRVRVASFLAQVGHESMSTKTTREIWQGSPAQGTPAQHRYDTRTDLGNSPERDGDGFFYRGRGYIQTTGKANMRRTGRALGLDLVNHPELLDIPKHAARSAAYFYDSTGCDDLADGLNGRGDAADLRQFDKITKRINGGYNGRIDRQARYLRALDTLTDEQFANYFTPATRSRLDRAKARVGMTLDPAPGTPAAAQTSSTTNSCSLTPSPDPKRQPETAADAPANASDATANTPEGSLIDEIPVNDTTRSAGQVAARTVGNRLARPVAWLTAALIAGEVWAWLMLAVVVVGLGYLGFKYRKQIKAQAIRLLRKAKGA